MKTIRTRVVGAFSLILVILAALGVNAYIANRAIGVEARRVRVAADAGVSHTEFLVHLRSTLEHAKLFAASEDAIDRESLGAAVDALDATSAALGAADPVGASSTALRREKDAYARSLAGIIGLITARQRQSSDLIEALTSVQVFVAAIAQRTREDQPRAAAAIALMEGVTSSGISALRYRASRDPSDIEASKRWSAEARDAVRRLAATGAQDDDRLRKLMAGLAQPLAKYDDALLGVEAATDAFAAAKPEWDAASRTVLEDGIRARGADAAAQREAADRMLASVRVAGTFDLAATVAAIAAGLTLALLLVRNIVHPLVAMTRAMHRLAGGALDTPIPCGGRRDEIGAMAQALMVFRDGLTAVAAMSAGKEEERIAKHRRIEALEALNRAFEVDFGGFTSSLADAASRMTSSAKTLMDSSAQTTERCAAAGADADVASAGVRAVAAATVDVAARVEDIGRRVSTSAHEAVGAAARAHEADAAVTELQSGARRIGEVVGLIRAIAEETNLLALNATIEAARAGAAGRGFAVVAGEVKQLSVATARATQEIGRHVAEIQIAMKAAAATLGSIGVAVRIVGEGSAEVATTVRRQSDAVALIAADATTAAAAADEVSDNVAKVEADAASTDRAARMVLAAAGLVAEQAQAMRARVALFLDETRAA